MSIRRLPGIGGKLLISVFVVLLLVPGCKKGADKLTIGAVFPTSGPTADWGLSAYEGAELAVKHLAEDGVNIRLLPVEDNKGSTDESSAAVRRLVSLHGAQAIIGPITSENAGAAARTATELGVPLVSPAATAIRFTLDNSMAFRSCYSDDFQGRVLANFIASDLEATHAAAIFDPKDAYSSGLAAVFMEQFDSGDEQTISKIHVSLDDREFGPQLAKLAGLPGVDAIFFAGKYPETAAFIRQLRRKGIETPMVAGDAVDSPEFFSLAGSDAEGVFVTSHFSLKSDSPQVRRFVQDYSSTYDGKMPNVAAALTYDSVLMIAAAYSKNKTTASLGKQMMQLDSVLGVTGEISLDENKNPVKDVVILKANIAEKMFEFYKVVKP